MGKNVVAGTLGGVALLKSIKLLRNGRNVFDRPFGFHDLCYFTPRHFFIFKRVFLIVFHEFLWKEKLQQSWPNARVCCE